MAIAFIARKALFREMQEIDASNHLERLLARGGVRSVHWSVETLHPGGGGFASLTGDYIRLVVGLSGRRRVRIMRGGQAFRLTLAAGDCLVLGPHTWVVTEPGSSFVSLGVVLEGRNPRLVIARQVHRPAKRRPAAIPPAIRILPGLCDNITMNLAAALLDAGPGTSEALYPRRLAEALLLRVTRERPSVRSREAGKGFVTYSAAEHYTRENFARPLSREDVAKFLRIHPSHVTRLFLQFAGETFGGFLLRVRLESARTLLRDPRLTVSEVAYLAGFTSPNYFVRAYRQRYRETPGASRRGS
jgi:Transcriptional regulator containing an amidase domain and an AraC-type DNA-binding HTH domain